MGQEHQDWASAKAEQKKPPIPSHPLCARFFPMVYIYFCLLPVPSFTHKQFVILNQPCSRTTGPEGIYSIHLQEPNLQHPWATGPADSVRTLCSTQALFSSCHAPPCPAASLPPVTQAFVL